jgi:hypothetical protein
MDGSGWSESIPRYCRYKPSAVTASRASNNKTWIKPEYVGCEAASAGRRSDL